MKQEEKKEKDCIWKDLSFIFATQLRIVGVCMNNIREEWHVENNVRWWWSPEAATGNVFKKQERKYNKPQDKEERRNQNRHLLNGLKDWQKYERISKNKITEKRIVKE